MYAIHGELSLATEYANLKKGVELPFVSATVCADKDGNLFRSGSIEVVADGVRNVVTLEAKQVELLLKLMGFTGG